MIRVHISMVYSIEYIYTKILFIWYQPSLCRCVYEHEMNKKIRNRTNIVKCTIFCMRKASFAFQNSERNVDQIF